jgi:hypothetical protein
MARKSQRWQRSVPAPSQHRRKNNRRRQQRAADGRCAKRQWRNLEDAQRAAVGSLRHPDNLRDAVAIYVCPACGWYHQTSRTDGRDVVLVVERANEA